MGIRSGINTSITFATVTCDCGYGPTYMEIGSCQQCGKTWDHEDDYVKARRSVGAECVRLLAAPVLDEEARVDSLIEFLPRLTTWIAGFCESYEAASTAPHSEMSRLEASLRELRHLEATVAVRMRDLLSPQVWIVCDQLVRRFHAMAYYFMEVFVASGPSVATERLGQGQRELDGITTDLANVPTDELSLRQLVAEEPRTTGIGELPGQSRAPRDTTIRRETAYAWEQQLTLFTRRPTGKVVLIKRTKTSHEILASISDVGYQKLLMTQLGEPVELVSRGGRVLWWYGDALYWADDSLSVSAVLTLLMEREAKHARRLERAESYVSGIAAGTENKSAIRDPIPDDVKVFVWRRDEGKCVRCGSQQNLEFDHIIPLSTGGSNTARNLQLLCEPCNRSKGGNLV